MSRKRKMGVGMLAILGTLGAVGYLAYGAIRRMAYPLAPPMPPVVAKSMEMLVAELEAVLRSKAPGVLDRMRPGLTDEEVAALERQFGVLIPEELKALYRWRNGCPVRAANPGKLSADGPVPHHRFLPLDEALANRAALAAQSKDAGWVARAAYHVLAGESESWISLFDDGCGDGYYFDPRRTPAQGAVFYCLKEDGLYIFFPSVKSLLAAIVRAHEMGAFAWKENGEFGPGLYEDFERWPRIWRQFGASSIDASWP